MNTGYFLLIIIYLYGFPFFNLRAISADVFKIHHADIKELATLFSQFNHFPLIGGRICAEVFDFYSIAIKVIKASPQGIFLLKTGWSIAVAVLNIDRKASDKCHPRLIPLGL